MPPERRLMMDGAGDLLWQLAQLVQAILDGSAGDAERTAARRLVDHVLRPEPAPPLQAPRDRQPS